MPEFGDQSHEADDALVGNVEPDVKTRHDAMELSIGVAAIDIPQLRMLVGAPARIVTANGRDVAEIVHQPRLA